MPILPSKHGGGLGNQTRVMKHPNSLTKGNNDTLAALRTLLWALVQTQRAIFGCSVSAGVQLYFTLLWRCTERLLEGEWLAVVHFTAPLWQTNKEKGEFKKEKQEWNSTSSLLYSFNFPATLSLSLCLYQNIIHSLSLSSYTNAHAPTAGIKSTSLTLTSKRLAVGRHL